MAGQVDSTRFPSGDVPVRPVDEEVEETFRDEECLESGQRHPVKMRDPKLPSPEEVREHCLTHLPYRAWCPHCVRAKGKSMQHRKREEGDRVLPEVHVDYMFMGGVEDEGTKCILVAKDRDTRMVMSSVVPLKGASHEFPAMRVRAFINELGFEHTKLILSGNLFLWTQVKRSICVFVDARSDGQLVFGDNTIILS